MANNYELKFSDPSKTGFILVPSADISTGINNYDTSLDFVGSGYNNYGISIAQNFLKLLENFSSPYAPSNPIEGQLWYDTSNPDKKIIKVNNGTLTGTRWQPVSGIFQQVNDPSNEYASIVVDGDLWIDTNSFQLKLRSNNNWVTVGPTFTSNGNKTGSEAISLESITGSFYPVILNWIDGKVVEIISYNEFTPRTVIDGFVTIKSGSNLTNKIATKYHGTADKTSSLIATNGAIFTANDFLKNKTLTSQTHEGTFIVESGSGIQINNSNLNKSIKIYNNASGSFLELSNTSNSLLIGNTTSSFIKVNSLYGNIGINTSTSINSPSLDVYGNAKFLDNLTVISNTYTNNALVIYGSSQIFGNQTVTNRLSVLGNTFLQGTVNIGKPAFSSSLPKSVLIPSINNYYDIGSTSSTFDTLYVSNIGKIGTNVNIYGTVYGTTTKLENSRDFKIYGQTTASIISFDGSNNVEFNTSLTRNAILNQDLTAITTLTQTILVLNTASEFNNLEKISKADFLSDVYNLVFKTGMITPFAGSIIPSGWLLCDGSTYSILTHQNLYNVIGAEYGNRLPDMSYSTTATNVVSSTIDYIKYIIKT